MMTKKTIEFANEWVNGGKPCVYRYGYAWKGASCKSISKEEALKLLPKYSFGIGFYELAFITHNGEIVLEFNELGLNDLY